jgi:hypothetical protein
MPLQLFHATSCAIRRGGCAGTGHDSQEPGSVLVPSGGVSAAVLPPGIRFLLRQAHRCRPLALQRQPVCIVEINIVDP